MASKLIVKIAFPLLTVAVLVGSIVLWNQAPEETKRSVSYSVIAFYNQARIAVLSHLLKQLRPAPTPPIEPTKETAQAPSNLPTPPFAVPDVPKVSILPVPPFAMPSVPKIPHKPGKPIQFVKKTVDHVSLYETIIDLKDPDSYVAVRLANKATQANSAGMSFGDENFDALVKRSQGSLVMNGTFFSKDDEKRVMGNLVSDGRFLKYSQWEDYGTTFGLKAGNEPTMVTATIEGQPKWEDHWFSLTCGPRLLKEGEVWLYPDLEKFKDPHVLGIGPRVALGFPPSKNKLILVTFLSGLSLKQEAQLMKDLGCSEAMNLDGGASRALAHNSSIVIPAGRPLTNVIVVYDVAHKAPQSLISSWQEFQHGARPTLTSQSGSVPTLFGSDHPASY